MTRKVNLLDPACEPSDGQLRSLMRSMIAEVRAKSQATDAAFFAQLTQRANEIGAKYRNRQ